MPVIPLRYNESEIADIRAFASEKKLPLSTAIKHLARAGVAAHVDGSTLESQANRLQALLQYQVELLMLARLQASGNKGQLQQAQEMAKKFYAQLTERV